jgi:bifunctional non-homologous end joining protein LigD
MPRKPSAREQLAEYRRKRDFGRTAEPAGDDAGARKATGKSAKKATRARSTERRLEFVVQKHAASHLHYDLRLELDGVMKSWAVPKGPAPDPSIKRLAMQVEDHPMEYNTFEGTIPQGEYGGGTVMLWDRGWYEPEKGGGEDGVREGVRKGDLKVIFHGKRLKGSWVLVRTRGWGASRGSGKPSWLLIKHRDEHAEAGDALVERHTTSVVSKKTMEQIGGATQRRVWHSNRGQGVRSPERMAAARDDDQSDRKRPRTVAEVRAARAASARAAEKAVSSGRRRTRKAE